MFFKLLTWFNKGSILYPCPRVSCLSFLSKKSHLINDHSQTARLTTAQPTLIPTSIRTITGNCHYCRTLRSMSVGLLHWVVFILLLLYWGGGYVLDSSEEGSSIWGPSHRDCWPRPLWFLTGVMLTLELSWKYPAISSFCSLLCIWNWKKKNVLEQEALRIVLEPGVQTVRLRTHQTQT